MKITPVIDPFRYVKIQLGTRPRGQKNRKLRDHVYSFRFSVSSRASKLAYWKWIEVRYNAFSQWVVS